MVRSDPIKKPTNDHHRARHLRCAQTLKDAGFPPKQAEATAQVLGDALADVATKEGLDRHATMQKADLKAAVDRLEGKLDDAALASTRRSTTRRAPGSPTSRPQSTASKPRSTTRRAPGKAELKAAVELIETKFDAVNQRLHSMETSTQKQFASVQEQLGSFRDQFRHQARVTYILLGIIAGLAFGDLVVPYLPSGKTPTAPPAAAESPTALPAIHSIPPRSSTEAEALDNPAKTPPPSSTP